MIGGAEATELCQKELLCCVVVRKEGGRKEREPAASEGLSTRRGSWWLISNHKPGTYLGPGQASVRLCEETSSR